MERNAINSPSEVPNMNIKEDFIFAQRPSSNHSLSNNLRRVKVVTNNLIVNFNQIQKKCYEYYIEFPNIIFNENDQKRQAIKNLEKEIKKIYYPCKFAGNNFFSMKDIKEDTCLNTNIMEQDCIAVIKNSSHSIDLSKIYNDPSIKREIKFLVENLIKNIIRANAKMIKLNYTNYYDLSTMKSISDNAYLINGFSTSFRSTESGFYLLVNVKNKFMNKQNCLDKLLQIRREYPKDFRKEAEKIFSGMIVLTTYGTPRTYTLKGVNFDATIVNRTIKIQKTGKEISLKQYYEENYPNLKGKISDNQPLLVVEQKRSDGNLEEIFLVPELCQLTGIDDKAAADIKKNMSKTTKQRPNEKMNSITNFLKLLENKEPKKIKNKKSINDEYDSPFKIKEQWGLGFNNFKTLEAKLLPQPEIEFFNHGKPINFYPYFLYI